MAYSEREQAIYDWVKGTVPEVFFQRERAEEEMGAIVKAFAMVEDVIDSMINRAKIMQAPGPVPGEPDWLGEHARDRDTERQLDETDDSLRLRLRSFAEVVTRPAIMALVDRLVGATGSAAVETLFDGIYLGNVIDAVYGDWATPAPTYTGPTIDVDADKGQMTIHGLNVLEPAATTGQPWYMRRYLHVEGAADSANNGRFRIVGVGRDGSGPTWLTVENIDAVESNVDETALLWSLDADEATPSAAPVNAFLGRGYQFANKGFTIILPEGTAEDVRRSVEAALQRAKSMGVVARVEVHQP